MDSSSKKGRLSKEQLKKAMQFESAQFEEYYLWLEKHMPPAFFEEVEQEHLMLIAHNLMGFHLQDHFSHIYLKDCAFVLCLDSPDVDLRVLKHYNLYGIKNYRTFLSDCPPPIRGIKSKLRIATIYFTFLEDEKKGNACSTLLEEDKKKEVFSSLKKRDPDLSSPDFEKLICGMDERFLRSMNAERLSLALHMFFRAKTRDYCQYEVRQNEDWESGTEDTPSMQIVFAWRNTPKHRFIYRLAKTIYRHNLVMKRVNATYINPYSNDSILLMSVGLHGAKGKAAWKEADVGDFLRELVTLKYFDYLDTIESIFVDTKLISGNFGNLLRTIISFVHQVLTQADSNLYSFNNIEEALCRHPELTLQICKLFIYKFDPERSNFKKYEKERKSLLQLVEELDTGNVTNDQRRKNVFMQCIYFIQYTLKTNFYRNNKSAFSFRLDPKYLDHMPIDRSEKFPELPFAIFFIQGMHFIGFHIRFKDLSRGGVRTVFPQRIEQMLSERNNVFSECYNLAYTQQKKNKDIPEGGAKAVIFLEPTEKMHSEVDIYRKELKWAGHSQKSVEEKLKKFRIEQKTEYLYQSQRAFVHSLVTLVNADPSGVLRAKNVIDYWKKPEFLYLGPDENMHNEMIDWIAEYSKTCGYAPGIAFISSKPKSGINHKEYGVTSFGVNVYMQEALKYIGINPKRDEFTVKISGGPDGDVAGNQILNLQRFFPKTAKLLALIDVSGTIYDPEGLDLNIMAELFHSGKSIREYPPQKLSDGGFLLDVFTKKDQRTYSQQTLCYRKENGKLIEDWLSGSDMNHLLRSNVNQVKTDIFIPAGGRPRTLNENNYKEYLDETGVPTSKAIVEGANLYLTPKARRELEKLGVLIFKDSSANKGGVICSSLEVLFGLTLSEEEFAVNKEEIMEEVLAFIKEKAESEAKLMLSVCKETNSYLTDVSEWVSARINKYTYQILDYLEKVPLATNIDDPLIRSLLSYCPKILQEKYSDRVLERIPDIHKKAIIACYIASHLVYDKGLKWSPSVVDILPIITDEIPIPKISKKN